MGQSRTNRVRGNKRTASEALTREHVYADSSATYRKFRQKLGPDIDGAIQRITAAHQELERLAPTWPRNSQIDLVRTYLYVALNNLLLATHFTVAGYSQAAGQQLRSFAEACAMSMLLYLPQEHAAFKSAPMIYPAHKALGKVQKTTTMKQIRARLPLNASSWGQFVQFAKLYDHHSHAGAASLLMHLKGTWPAVSIFGGEFDIEKMDQYRIDLKMARLGANNVAQLAIAFDRSLQAAADKA